MIRTVFALTFIPTFAFAHDGLHHHPHGIEFGWVIAAAVGLVAGLAVSRSRSIAKVERT